MRRLLLLPFALGALALAQGGRAVSQPGPGRMVLTGLPPELAPAPSTPPPSTAMPASTLPPGAIPATAPGRLPGAPAAAEAPVPTPFPMTAEAGPWAICAAHYTGPDAIELARQVCLELRNKHRLPAYIFNHAEVERRKYREEMAKRAALYPGAPARRAVVRIPDSYAVLIGGFKDFDHASEYLKVVKKLPLPELKLADVVSGDGPNGRPAVRSKIAYDMVNVVEPNPNGKGGVVRHARVNPFETAMVVRNPTVVVAPRPVSKFDPAWKKFNEDEDYSLLNCKGAYTLIVKEYSGAAMVPGQGKSTGFLSSLGFGGDRLGDRLGASGAQRNGSAKLLRDRRLGFEAYVLHTKTSSFVTVGSFASANDPALLRMQQRLAVLKFNSSRNGVDPIGLMAHPIPAEVPHEERASR